MGVKILRFDYILLVIKNIIKCYCTDTDRAIVFTKFETPPLYWSYYVGIVLGSV